MGKRSEVEVILVGDELLRGDRRDAHLAYLGDILLAQGVRIGCAHVVGDDPDAIARLIRRGLQESRVLVVSGGLGPTHDDVTREGVADGLDLPLEFDSTQWEWIQGVFRRFHREADESNRRQAYFPQGAEPLENPNGTAPGFVVEKEGTIVFVLPGPPRELVPMMESVAIHRIRAVFDRGALLRETFRSTGVGESQMAAELKSLVERYGEDFHVSSLPGLGGVDIVVTQRDPTADVKRIRARVRALESDLRGFLGAKLYATGQKPLEAVVGDALRTCGATLAVAESLTGGAIGTSLTDIPGSSSYFLADLVTYSNEAKVALLDVSEDTLAQHGAVSEAVCREMASGVRARTGATYGLATTGIAGPDGGSEQKPVGLTFYGVAWQEADDVRHRVFPGDRRAVRERVRQASLLLLLDVVRARSGG